MRPWKGCLYWKTLIRTKPHAIGKYRIHSEGLAWVIIPGKWTFNLACMQIVPWRAFIWSWCLPGLVAAVMLLALPESPKYLLASKGPDAALPVLAKMYEWNHGANNKFPVEKISNTSADMNKSGSGFVGAVKNIAQMFKPPLLRCVIISHVSMFAVFMLSSGLYVWVPDILNNILHGADQISVCQIISDKFANATLSSKDACHAEVSVSVFPISMAMGAVFAITYLSIGVFINKIGRKSLYCGIMFICGIATVAAAFVPHGGAATALIILCLCSGCAASILAAIAVDVFPTSLRAMAMCMMYMVGRSGAAVGSNLLGVTLDTHCHMAFTGFGVFIAGSAFLMFFWPKPEKVRAEMEQQGFSY
ncbi:hypothetical protein O3G_MSEX005391 [Manduca sexta]|uniref:Uncharacterized protein n=1 Tax=Manduca sexta TaxID=7130 RepID=A0A921YYW4_MANSE|nr:hypothetical protein O3G_MSEX005391 [Manduca sexta]